MITREQIEETREWAQWATDTNLAPARGRYADLSDVCDLALQALDRERDAKLGRAVREAWGARSMGDAAQAGPTVYRIACERFVSAIATHLREESKS